MDAERFQQMEEDLREVKEAVVGNKQFRRKGLAERVEALEQWKVWLMLRLAAVIGVATVGWTLFKMWWEKH
jgi:hypothetical protein